jgi:hypothetical protein
MNDVLIGVLVGAVLILVLIRGMGMYFARRNAMLSLRAGIGGEIAAPRRPSVRHTRMFSGGSFVLTVAPRQPEQAFVAGENRFERAPGMEAPPIYSKHDAPPEYVDVTAPETARITIAG